MLIFKSTPNEMVESLVRNRALILTLVKREILGRYRGSIVGLVWVIIHPILMLAIYTFVFSVIFKAKWSQGSDSKTEFALMLFAGLIVFNLFGECFNRAPYLILNNINYVKKVVFPLEILPWVALGPAIFHALAALGVWILAYWIIYGVPHLTVLLFPLVVGPLILLILGVSWVLSSLGVYLRDLAQVIPLLTTILMFLSPIFFPVSALPPRFQPLMNLNPITPILGDARIVLFMGELPNFQSLLIQYLLSLIIAYIGFTWFQKTRKGFADVL